MQTSTLRGSRLSLQQAHLWSLPESRQIYRVQCTILLEGTVDIGVLHTALQRIVNQHEILRTGFSSLPAMDLPVQVVHSHAMHVCPVINLKHLSILDQKVRIDELFAATVEEPFDFEHGPLLRTFLLLLSETCAVLFVSLPALCADTATLQRFVTELGRAYTACLTGEELTEEPLQYADVSAWQDELLQEEDAASYFEDWRTANQSQLLNTGVPFTFPTPIKSDTQFNPRYLVIPLEMELCDRINAFVRQTNSSLAAFLLTCWQALLWRLTGEPTVVIGVACDGRLYEELTNVLGMCTRTVPVSTQFGKDQSFMQVVTQVGASLENAIKWQYYFTNQVTDNEQQKRISFPLGFEITHWSSHVSSSGITLSLQHCYACTERFALKLVARQIDGALHLELHYDATRISSVHVQHLAEYFSTLVANVIASPSVPISTLELLSYSEKQRLLQLFAGTETSYAHQSLQQLFEEQVVHTPEHIAVICGGEQLTYVQLNICANQLAHWLRQQGIGRNALVGLCVERSVHMIIGLLGILKAGAAYLPLDPDNPPARLAFQLNESRVSLLLTQGELLHRLPEWDGEIACLERWKMMNADEQCANPSVVTDPDDLAYVMYTSGSTGMPKGVMVRQRSVVNYTQYMRGIIAPEAGLHFATVSTLAADLGNTAIFCALLSGGCLHILRYEIVTDGIAFARYMTEHPIDVLKIVPSHLSALLAASEDVAILPRRYLVLGGEVLPKALLSRLWQLNGSCVVLNHYGPTEATIGALVNVLGTLGTEGKLEDGAGETVSVPIGRPIANTEAYILDEHLRLVPVGVTGELYIGGVGLAAGYLHQPEQTQERFLCHPFNSQLGARIYKTGDLVRATNTGQIEFVGRIDNQVKLRGYRIELGEIEACLTRHSDVLACAVLLREDIPGEHRLVAYVVPWQKPGPSSVELRRFLSEKLPEHMIPSAFTTIEGLPLTVNGKVDRQRLPIPEKEEDTAKVSYVPPRSPIEEGLVGIWEDVLSYQHIGIHDNFFSLGGHSLLVTQVVSRIRSVFGVELPIQSLFEASTIAELAESIEKALHHEQVGDDFPVVPVPHHGDLPLSFAQQRLWFLNQLAQDDISYNKSVALRIAGTLNVRALEQSLSEIVRRHESLRTTFHLSDGQPIQVIGSADTFYVQHIDVRLLALDKRETETYQLTQTEAQRPFNLCRGPLIRVTLIRLDENDQLLLVIMHHIISDAWSNSVFLHELSVLYEAFIQGKPSPLPALLIQYTDYAIWQRQWLQGNMFEKQLSYWKQQLQGIEPLNLPIDQPRPSVQTSHGAEQSICLPEALLQRINGLSQREGVTLFMTLLAAFQVLLQYYTGQNEIAVGTPITNRNRVEVEALIGFFVNTLVLRTDLSGNPMFVEVLQRVRKVALEAYAHQDLPFEKLVDALQTQRDLSRSPLFQAMFILQNMPYPLEQLVGTTVSTVSGKNTTAKFDITFEIVNTGQELLCTAEYNTDLFEAGTISRLLGHWQALLESIVAHPEARLTDLSLLTAPEQQQLLVDWNATQVAYPEKRCLHQLFEAQVTRTPDAVAVVFEDEQLTYAELNGRANCLAHYLRHLGVSADVLVGICIERSLAMVVALLGILKAGGAYVPLDPAYPPDRLAFMLHDAHVSVLLTQQKLLESLPEHQADMICLDSDWGKIAQEDEVTPANTVQAENLAYVIYTSGSTGRPKGVQIFHRAVVNLLLFVQRELGVTSHDTLLAITTLSFDIAALELFLPLITGASLFIERREVVADGMKLLEKLSSAHPTIMQATPSTWRMLLDTGLTTLQGTRILCGGEALSQELARQLLSRKPDILLNMYGPTETTIWSTCCKVFPTKAISVGRPIANTQIYLLDRFMRPVPIGVPGELYIGGVGVARGYLNQPELTAEKFVPDPFSKESGSRLYRTGDLACYLPDGAIKYLDRRDQQVKIRGYRLELGEIETILREQPSIREAVVVMREETPGEKRLVAYLVTDQLQTPAISVIRRALREKLPEYMMPSAWVFLDALPLTPNGKLNRNALPAPGSQAKQKREDMPRSVVEELLLDIWQEVLNTPVLGIHENFFEVGGHSLLATQVLSRIRTTLGVEIPLRSLFEAPTAAELARQIEQTLRGKGQQEGPALVPISREVPLPASFAQQRFWFLQQLQPRSTTYHISLALSLEGELQMPAWQQSLQLVVQRHEDLRTTFQQIEEQVMQVIGPAEEMALASLDFRSLAEEEREQALQRLMQQEAQLPFDLARGPLLRAMLVRLQEQKYVFLLTMHHIISDGWSSHVLLEELTTMYQAAVQGCPASLSPLPVQYADFAVWQRQWLQDEVLEKQLAYWRQQLAGIEPLELPLDHPRPALQSQRGARVVGHLTAELSQQLKQVSQREGVTLFMLLVAAFQVLLARYTGQEDIAVGTPIANRNREEIEGLIGLFVNTLVLRTDLSGNPPFRELLRRVREMALQAYAHQDVPFEKVVEVLQPERDLSRTPLFQVMFILQQEPRTLNEIAGIRLSPLERESQTAKFDLTLVVTEREQEWRCALEYDGALFEAGTISRLLGHWQTLLESIVTHPEAHLNELSLLTALEQQQFLVDWNATQVAYPEKRCLHQLFEAQVIRTPDAVAVIFEDEQLTYAELNGRANCLAHYLRHLGVSADVLVGICIERSLATVVALLGILKAGGAYVPLDPAYPPDRLAFMLHDTHVSVLLTQQKLVESLPEHQADVICLDSDWGKIAQEDEVTPVNTVQAENLAYVIYTSGSVGRPKGVLVTQKNLTNSIQARLIYYRVPVTAFLLLSSFAFDSSIAGICWTLCQGGMLVLPQQGTEQDPSLLAELIAHHQITHVLCIPSLYSLLLAQATPQQLLSLLTVIVAGETCPRELPERHHTSLPNTAIFNEYGPTECTVWSSVYEIGTQELRTAIPIGGPIANTQIYLLDRFLRPVPIGVPGELYIGGRGVARGYLNQPELTAEQFVPDPFSKESGSRLYRTGDLACYLPDGAIKYLGRRDQQVKIRGYRLELGEIGTILREQPSIREAVVVMREETPGEKRLVAYLVAEQQQRPAISGIRRALREKLPEYMMPSAWVFLDALPLTPNGKLNRNALPMPGSQAKQRQKTEDMPRSAVEELLLDIWQEVLNIPVLGIHENFFEVGGHSLLATQVLSRIRTTLGGEIPLRSLFEAPTVAELARQVEQTLRGKGQQEGPALVPISREVPLPASFAQQRFWFLQQLQPRGTTYHISLALSLEGELQVPAWQQSLQLMVQRHEDLRTTFQQIEEQVMQVIGPAEEVALASLDFRSLAEEACEQALQRLMQQEAALPFDLARGPLLRAMLVRLQEQKYVFLLTMHHIIADGWSSRILLEELTMGYQAAVQGRPAPLSPLPVQYADFAVWQRQWLQDEVLEKQLAYWRQQLAGMEPLELPLDHPRPALQSQRGARVVGHLTAELSQQLKQVSQREGVTLFMLLVAAFQVLLARYTGQEDIAVGTPIANRNREEIEGLIGLFVNTLVLRTDLSGNPPFRELLRRVREMALQAYAHQDVPFEKVVEVLQPERDLSRTPLFQVMFILQQEPRTLNEIAGIRLSPLERESQTAKFDLTLVVTEREQEWRCALEYDGALFEAGTISRLLDHWQVLLEGIVASPEQRLSDLPLLGKAEQDQLHVLWNISYAKYDQDLSVHQLFEKQVERNPEAVALISGKEAVTYHELNRRANQLAHYLLKRGVGLEVLVGIQIERSVEFVVSALAVLKAGGIYVAIDPTLPQERLAFILQDTALQIILTQKHLTSRISTNEIQIVCLDADKTLIALEDEANPAKVVYAEQGVYVIYTSGSTGVPKGVAITHEGLLNLVWWHQHAFDVHADDRATLLAEIGFDASVWELWPYLTAGARICIVDDETRVSASELLRWLNAQQISICFLPTPLAEEVLSREEVKDLRVRLLLTGGDRLSRFSTPEMRFTLVNNYGPTENTVVTSSGIITPQEQNDVLPSIGWPIANTRVYLLDQHLQPIPIGVHGEIYISSPGLARCYLHQPMLTAEKFLPDPFSDEPGRRMYRTGDLARYLADGRIEFIGRTDHQVKIRGFRIELGEIEAVLLQQPDVQECVVLVQEDATRGQHLMAYIVAKKNSMLSVSVLSTYLQEKLPQYMIPSSFVMLDELPRTSTGKIDRQTLATLKREPEIRQIVRPRDTIEFQLLCIWEDVLNRRPISVRDNFFELGGHSILAVRLMSKIYQHFGHDLALSTFFHYPTIADLATILRQQTIPECWSALVPIQPHGSRPPFFCVHPSGGTVFRYTALARHLGPDQPFYGLQVPELDQEYPSLDRFEDIAAFYVAAVKSVQPQGPYFLGGWSMGGIVAFEMAQQLQSQGQQVALLAIIDSRIPTACLELDQPLEDVDSRQTAMIKMLIDVYRIPIADHFYQLAEDEQIAYILEQAKNIHLAPMDTNITQFRRLLRMHTTNYLAERRYTPCVYPHQITYFKAAEDEHISTRQDSQSNLTRGWCKLTTQKVNVHVLPGNHATILDEPLVQILAKAIEEHLYDEYNDV